MKHRSRKAACVECLVSDDASHSQRQELAARRHHSKRRSDRGQAGRVRIRNSAVSEFRCYNLVALQAGEVLPPFDHLLCSNDSSVQSSPCTGRLEPSANTSAATERNSGEVTTTLPSLSKSMSVGNISIPS